MARRSTRMAQVQRSLTEALNSALDMGAWQPMTSRCQGDADDIAPPQQRSASAAAHDALASMLTWVSLLVRKGLGGRVCVRGVGGSPPHQRC